MDMNKLIKIIRMSEDPEWATRSPDQQQIVPPEPVAPIKQGGIPKAPGVVGASPSPGKMNPQALKKAADSMLLGDQSQQGSSMPSGIPGQEGSANTSLSNALRSRRLARKSSESMPKMGSIGYGSGGNY